MLAQLVAPAVRQHLFSQMAIALTRHCLCSPFAVHGHVTVAATPALVALTLQTCLTAAVVVAMLYDHTFGMAYHSGPCSAAAAKSQQRCTNGQHQTVHIKFPIMTGLLR